MEQLTGIPVSSGIVIGRVFRVGRAEQRVPHRHIESDGAGEELKRVDLAFEAAITDLQTLRDRTREELGEEPAKIFEFHVGLLRDPSLRQPIRDRIERDLVVAEWAVADEFRSVADRFSAMGSEVFAQKASDIIDLDRRVLDQLMGENTSRLATLNEPVVIVAHELTPSQTAGMDRSKVLGFATDIGGRTSHVSIVARAVDIPAVVGCHQISRMVENGDQIIIDGDAGTVIVNPSEELVEEYLKRQSQVSSYRAELRRTAVGEAVTTDGVSIKLLGNIEFPDEIPSVLENGGEGVGLYRTEFLYLTSGHEPTEDDHYQAYLTAVRLLEGRTLVIRTQDLGADKYTQEQAEEPERNPFLGCRSIRYSLQNLAGFKTQLRAILRAAAEGPVKVMFPLVSNVMEIRQAKMLLADVAEELVEDGIPHGDDVEIGMMVEVPSAALMARAFSSEVEFFSIGTNDLIQYTLAVDRGNERVANLYTGASPAVIQLIKSVIRAARRKKVDVSLCGEVAGEPIYTMLLLGLGLRTLSLVPTQIPLIKTVIRTVTIQHCERIARKVGTFDSERQVLNYLRDELRKIDPGSPGGWTAD
ncbi:MAG: phosphoenolpyruvate--protein phosphotransferase [Phycisphaerae bacterium]|nr:phosphoenolpyruvate--protein phosphotransferase [Phycisphaerae bacterium]